MTIHAPSIADARRVVSSSPEPYQPAEPVEVYVDGEIVYAGDVAGLLALDAP